MTENEAQNLFDGFDTDGIEADAEQRWPEQARQSRAAIETMSDADRLAARATHDRRLRELAALLHEDASAGDARVQEVVAELYRAMTSLWTPDRAAFTMVGRQLATQADSRAMLERIAPELPSFTQDAYAEFAATRLS